MKIMTNREKQAARVLRWTRKYPGWWYLVCTPDDGHMNMVMMSRLISHLAKHQLYELIMVLLMVHRNTDYVRCACRHVVFEMVADNWNGNIVGKEWLIRKILRQLR